MKVKIHLIVFTLFSLTTTIMAQGVDFPDTPSQAPIGGLSLLAAAGGALAWKKLRKLHQK
ncbi:MAG: hypothetical protein HOK52_03755 [Candidatus Marinimicrobia bacterium]|jgi:AICAR transformylase/IMP cyclohydrolase PurH|nr:hypothetical protein [Candidatus Neomarinimicrobiota bacterium]MBT3937337.1 hypothetical protein [Candidatus Neomarinimicrobiota bacterium]MBT3961179.1 hypothetical protein [Candidatus Neomarinimicrobiota bacterium]MBT4382173.1 hypothetical protein [Candidatus Neomarinimicrobiota bacterium]MBT4635629.1 hypothetical protein [Candidatus Neomarinimicrobiota bacterium]